MYLKYIFPYQIPLSRIFHDWWKHGSFRGHGILAVPPAAPSCQPRAHPKVLIQVAPVTAPRPVRGGGVGAVAPLALQAGAPSHRRSRQGPAAGFESLGSEVRPGAHLHLHRGDLEVEDAAMAQPALGWSQAQERLGAKEKQNREKSVTSQRKSGEVLNYYSLVTFAINHCKSKTPIRFRFFGKDYV